jgi:hypothetical protein
MDHTLETEILRVHAPVCKSEFEKNIFSDIVIWGYERNINRIKNGLEPIVREDVKELAEEYWATLLS